MLVQRKLQDKGNGGKDWAMLISRRAEAIVGESLAGQGKGWAKAPRGRKRGTRGERIFWGNLAWMLDRQLCLSRLLESHGFLPNVPRVKVPNQPCQLFPRLQLDPLRTLLLDSPLRFRIHLFPTFLQASRPDFLLDLFL
jgi:hypothetical protein